jgi:hypothetical protein
VLQILRTLAVSLVVLAVAMSGSALASSSSHHAGPTAKAAKKHRKHKHKRHRRHRRHRGQSGTSGTSGTNGTNGTPGMQGPQGPAGPSEQFAFSDASATPIGTGPDDTVVGTLNLPAGGSYNVSASVELGNNQASANSVTCKLLENFNPIASGTEDLTPLATFSRTISLTAASTGGAIKLACTADKPAQARNRAITAVRVGKTTTQ